MITVKLQGGLGNQLFQYALGRALSKQLRTDLFLDTSFYKNKADRSYMLGSFRVKATEKSINTETKNVHIVREKTENFDPAILESGEDSFLNGFWQSEKYFKNIATDLRDEIALKNPLPDSAQEITKKMAATESVFVHVRRGDYTTSKHQRIYAQCTEGYYRKALKTIKTSVKKQNLHVFVFSDDIEWVKNNIAFEDPVNFMERGRFTDAEELVLMSMCKHSVTANSTYSWWAAWLNANPNKIVVTPRKWFIGGTRNEKDLIPESWIRLDVPRVSIVMPVYNASMSLHEAIESMLAQTFTDFEFLIIDDGSTDDSASIINSYKDPRIRVLSNGKNEGLVYSLNRGIDEAFGEYIARMDSDDISLPQRLEEQVAFMDSRPEIGVSGTWIQTIDEHGKNLKYTNKYLTEPEDIRAGMLFNTPFAHPSVMIRTSVLRKTGLRYDMEDRFYYEDYSLWLKLAQVTKFANLPKALLKYRIHKKSSSRSNATENKAGADALRASQVRTLGLEPSVKQITLHNSLRPENPSTTMEFLTEEESWLIKLMNANVQSGIYQKKSLEKVLYKRWRTLAGLNATRNSGVWKKFKISPLFVFGGAKRHIDSLKIFLKCL